MQIINLIIITGFLIQGLNSHALDLAFLPDKDAKYSFCTNSLKHPATQEGHTNLKTELEAVYQSCFSEFSADEAKVAELSIYYENTLAKLEDCDNEDGYTTEFSDFNSLTDYVYRQNVHVFNNWRKTYADTANTFPQVGRFTINEDNKEYCTATYVEMPTGEKGFVTSAHCVYTAGRTAYHKKLSDFKVELGIFADGSNPVYTVKRARCGTRDTLSDSAESWKDECFLTMNEKIPGSIKPLKRKFLTTKQQNQKISTNPIVGLVGFNSKRRGRSLYDASGNGPYNNASTRSLQTCNMLPNNYERHSGIATITPHSCDTMDGTSGSAVIQYNKATKEWEHIGTYKGHTEINSGQWINYSINVHPSEWKYDSDHN